MASRPSHRFIETVKQLSHDDDEWSVLSLILDSDDSITVSQLRFKDQARPLRIIAGASNGILIAALARSDLAFREIIKQLPLSLAARRTANVASQRAAFDDWCVISRLIPFDSWFLSWFLPGDRRCLQELVAGALPRPDSV